MLCANKVDLRAEAAAQGRRVVSRDEGEKMARDHSAIFIETSAKDGNNVIDALVQLSRYGLLLSLSLSPLQLGTLQGHVLIRGCRGSDFRFKDP